jgi:hypothetical protein
MCIRTPDRADPKGATLFQKKAKIGIFCLVRSRFDANLQSAEKLKTLPNLEGFLVSSLGSRFCGPFWLRYHYPLRLQTSRNGSAPCILPLIVDSIYAFGTRTNRGA